MSVHKKDRRGEAGVSLIETLLTVGALAAILLVIVQFLQQFARDEMIQATGNHVRIVHMAASETMRDISTFNAIYALVEDNGGALEIPILAESNPNSTRVNVNPYGVSLESGGSGVPASSLINGGRTIAGAVIDSQFMDSLPQGQGLTVVVKRVDDPANPDDERRLVAIVASLERMSEHDLREISASVGSTGGVMSAIEPADPAECLAGNCAMTLRSAFGNWITDAVGFAGTPWYTAVSTAPPTEEDGGYLVSLQFVNESELAGDYLYRTAQPLHPELNRMNTNLNLGGFDVVGADNVFVTGADGLDVTQTVHAQGSVHVAGNMQVQGNLTVDGDMAAGVMTLDPSYDVTDPRFGGGVPPRNVVIEGTLNTRDMSTVGNMYADSAAFETLRSPDIRTLEVETGILHVESPDGIFTTGMQADALTVQEVTQVGDITAGTVAGSGPGMVMGVVQSRVGGRLNVEGNVDAARAAASNVDIDRLEQCWEGC